MPWYMQSRLLSPEGDSGGSGGSSSNSSGEGESKTADFLTKKEARSIFSSIVKEQLSAFTTSFKSDFDAALAPIRETISKPKETEKPTAKTAEGAAGGAQAAVEDPRLSDALARIEALTKSQEKLANESKEAKKQAKEERERANRSKAFGDLKSTLGSKVKPEAVDTVADLLRARGHLVHDDEGNARLKFKIDDEDHELALEDGVAHYIKTKEASLFLPPPTGGAGANKRPPPSTGLGANGSSANGSQLTPVQALMAATGRSIGDLIKNG